MLIALFSILGIVIGVVLQYRFGRIQEERKHNRILQTEAYADYLKAVADAAHLSLGKESEVHARTANAKARICLYGSPGVVEKLAQFERSGGAIITEEQHVDFIKLVQAMRGDKKVTSADLDFVLMGAKEGRPIRQRLK
jgi:hypothetical protein